MARGSRWSEPPRRYDESCEWAIWIALCHWPTESRASGEAESLAAAATERQRTSGKPPGPNEILSSRLRCRLVVFRAVVRMRTGFMISCDIAYSRSPAASSSFVGGIVGARDNQLGVVGVVPGTPIWSVRVVAEES